MKTSPACASVKIQLCVVHYPGDQSQALLGVCGRIAGLPSNLPIEALAAYGDQPLPQRMAEAVLVALELHQDLPIAGVDVTAAEIGLPGRTLQRALRREGVTYREIVRRLRLRRRQELLVSTPKPLAEVALRAGYSDPSNFHRAFQLQTGMTPGRFREASRSPATVREEQR